MFHWGPKISELRDAQEWGTRCGAFDGDSCALPLRGMRVEAEVGAITANVQLELTYVNVTDRRVEVDYVFDLPQAVITSLTATLGGRPITAKLVARERAQEQYDDAIAAGGRATLAQTSDDDPQVVCISLGALAAGESAKLTLSYVSDVAATSSLRGTDLVFAIPASKHLLPHSGRGEGLDATVRLAMGEALKGWECPSHAGVISVNDGGVTVVRLRQNIREVSPAEIRLILRLRDALSSSAIVCPPPAEKARAPVQEDPDAPDVGQHDNPPVAAVAETGLPVLQVSLVPQLEDVCDDATGMEVCFIVDCSGSMSGAKMRQSKDAMQVMLRGLPAGCSFNIVPFGSSYSILFFKPEVYGDSTMRQASEYVSYLDANMGGTSILRPLQYCVEGHKKRSHQMNGIQQPHSLIVFILTDGEVHDTSDVLSYVREAVKDNERIFCLGVGAEASRYLCRGLATIGNGTVEFTKPGEAVEDVCLDQMSRALTSVAGGTTIDWGCRVHNCAQTVVGTVLSGERVTSFCFLEDEDAPAGPVQLVSRTGKVLARAEITRVELSDSSRRAAQVLAASAAVRNIEKLEQTAKERGAKDEAERARARGTEMALGVGVLSPYTSFVAIGAGTVEAVDSPMLFGTECDRGPKIARRRGRSRSRSAIGAGTVEAVDLPMLFGTECDHGPKIVRRRGRSRSRSPSGLLGGTAKRHRSGDPDRDDDRERFRFRGLDGCQAVRPGWSAISFRGNRGTRGRGVCHNKSMSSSDYWSRSAPGARNWGSSLGACSRGVPALGGSLPRDTCFKMESSRCYSAALRFSPSSRRECLFVDEHPVPSPGTGTMRRPVPQPTKDPFLVLVHEQSSLGFWHISDVLLGLLCLTKEKVMQSAHASAIDMWMTALCMAWLEIKLGDKKNRWAMIYRKALKWLNRASRAAGLDSAGVLSDARTMFAA